MGAARGLTQQRGRQLEIKNNQGGRIINYNGDAIKRRNRKPRRMKEESLLVVMKEKEGKEDIFSNTWIMHEDTQCLKRKLVFVFGLYPK